MSLIITMHLHCRRIPGDTGWVLDGFPATAFQAKLLEKALTGGGDALGRDDSKTDVKDKDGKKAGKKSKLAPDPRPAPPPPEPGSGLNVVILFDVTNETVLKRSAGRTCKQWFYAIEVDYLCYWIG